MNPQNPLQPGQLLVTPQGTHIYDMQMNYLGMIPPVAAVPTAPVAPAPAPAVAPVAAAPAPAAAAPAPVQPVEHPDPENLTVVAEANKVGKDLFANSEPDAKERPDRQIYLDASKEHVKEEDTKMRKQMEGGALM